MKKNRSIKETIIVEENIIDIHDTNPSLEGNSQLVPVDDSQEQLSEEINMVVDFVSDPDVDSDQKAATIDADTAKEPEGTEQETELFPSNALELQISKLVNAEQDIVLEPENEVKEPLVLAMDEASEPINDVRGDHSMETVEQDAQILLSEIGDLSEDDTLEKFDDTPAIQIDIEQELLKAAEALDEEEDDLPIIEHKTAVMRISVRKLLDMWRNKEVILPLCQRLYVWNKAQSELLLDTVQRGITCASITFDENKGKLYLTDGLQRTTSLMLTTNNADLSPEVKKKVADYEITCEFNYDMSPKEIKMHFARLNSGISLASSYKEISKLNSKLNQAVVELAAHPFLKADLMGTTYKKSGHYILIALNALLAAAGVPIGTCKAKQMCAELEKHAQKVLENKSNAKKLVDRIAEIFSKLDQSIINGAMNSNYLGTLVHVLADMKVKDTQVAAMTNYIFATKPAAKEYAITTRNGAADVSKCRDRYALLSKWVKELPVAKFNELEFKKWVKTNSKAPLRDSSKKYLVDLQEFDVDEQKIIFNHLINRNVTAYDKFITDKYKALEVQH